MPDIGRYNTLRIVKLREVGAYLDGGDLGEILLPRRYVPKNAQPGEAVEIFLYLDSEDRLIATTERPHAQVGEFACLQAVSVGPVGAFLDWGLPKDLLVPFVEQRRPMVAGKRYCVHVYLDTASRRIAASAKLDKFLDLTPAPYREGQEVDLLIAGRTDLGYKAVVENAHWGVLYENEVFQPLSPGQRLKGFIKKIREDGKIDLRLDKPGYGKIEELAQAILRALEENEGYLEVNDDSSPQLIAGLFGASKKSFKMAIGALYKKRLITIGPDGIALVSAGVPPKGPGGDARGGRTKP
jgi:hypothetical protein